MNRSILKPNAPLFEGLQRVLDPVVTIVCGILAYHVYPPLAEIALVEMQDVESVKAGITATA